MATVRTPKYDMTSADVGTFAYQLFGDRNAIPLSILSVTKTTGKNGSGVTYYNPQDVVAYAKYKGKTNTAIAKAMTYHDEFADEPWTNEDIKNYNANYNTTIKSISDKINQTRPEANAYITTKVNKDGESVYTLYFNDVDGNKIGVDLEGTDSFLFKDGTVNTSKFNAYFNSNAAISNALGTTYGNTNLGYANSSTAKQTLPTDLTLTDGDIAELQTNLPDVENYKSVNIGENSNVTKNLFNDYISNKGPDSIARGRLEDLINSADAINNALVDRTQQSIDNAKAQLIQEIRNDPELYSAVVAQLRNDANAEVIAGQRAANTATIADKANKTYAEQANELLEKLIGPEGAVGSVRESSYNNKTSALDAYIQGQLNAASSDAYKRLTDSEQAAQLLTLLGAASEVGAAQYADDTDARTAEVNKIANDKGLVTEATADGLNTSDYTTSKSVSEIKDTSISNKQYTDILNNPNAIALLSDPGYNDITSSKTYRDILTDYKLVDVLGDGTDSSKLSDVYKAYVNEANKASDKVFNQAQRAYIASITAGDVKTVDALTKLATTAGQSRGKLYAASALANQFKQQSNRGVTGRTLVDSHQQQVADNRTALDYANIDAYNKMTGYIGSGADPAGEATLSGIKNTFDNASTTAKGGYTDWADRYMVNRKKVDTSRATASLNDFIRTNSLSDTITRKNITNAVNNKS
jgi:hypothetical protein